MTTLTLKIEPGLKEKAQKIAKDFGLSLSSLIKMLLTHTVKSGKIDIEAKPRYHSGSELGDLDFDSLEDSLAYFKKEFERRKEYEGKISKKLSERS